MENSDSDNKNIVRFKPGRRFYVFLISLVLATAFWLLNALNKTYNEGVFIAIKYINLPENRAFSPVPLDRIKVELSGDGFSLVSLMDQAEEDTVVIDIATLSFESKGSRNTAYIPTSIIINKLRNSLSNNVNVSKISRDTIVVITERGRTKELLVKPSYDISLAKGLVLVKPVYVIPEYVTFHGPKVILDTATTIESAHYSFEEISETTEVEVKLSYNSKYIHPDYRSVKVVAEVEALTEGEVEIPITVIGLPKNKKVRLLPNTVKVKFSTGLSHYDFIEPKLFSVVVNYSDVSGNFSKLPINIQSSPSYVNIIQTIPERVDYLILELQVDTK